MKVNFSKFEKQEVWEPMIFKVKITENSRGESPLEETVSFIFSPSFSRNFNKVLSQMVTQVWLITYIKIGDKEKIKVKP